MVCSLTRVGLGYVLEAMLPLIRGVYGSCLRRIDESCAWRLRVAAIVPRCDGWRILRCQVRCMFWGSRRVVVEQLRSLRISSAVCVQVAAVGRFYAV